MQYWSLIPSATAERTRPRSPFALRQTMVAIAMAVVLGPCAVATEGVERTIWQIGKPDNAALAILPRESTIRTPSGIYYDALELSHEPAAQVSQGISEATAHPTIFYRQHADNRLYEVVTVNVTTQRITPSRPGSVFPVSKPLISLGAHASSVPRQRQVPEKSMLEACAPSPEPTTFMRNENRILVMTCTTV